MIIGADDYPLHQTAEPIAFAGTDRNFYDRFFFNGYKDDLFFAVALGVYPQLNIMDAAFSLIYEGKQYNLRFSKEMMDRLDLTLGAFSIEITKPLAETKITLQNNEKNISAELYARACHQAIEEPRFTRRQGSRAFMDYTRLTQNIEWQGTITLQGKKLEVEGATGTRDRSWGVRPIGAPDGNPTVPPLAPQFYWLWMPTHLGPFALFCHSNEDEKGEAWNRRLVLVDREQKSQAHLENFTLDVATTPTRRVERITLAGDELQATFLALPQKFYMHGLGYMHPEWGHGTYHGASAFAYDEIDLAQAEDKLQQGAFHHLHIQARSEVELVFRGKTFRGQGVIEQLLIGAHQPSGWS